MNDDHYEVTDWGVTPENDGEANSKNLQSLIDYIEYDPNQRSNDE